MCVTVSHEREGRIEHKPLVRIGFAFFPHVIGCGLTEVKSAQRYLRDFIPGQLDSETNHVNPSVNTSPAVCFIYLTFITLS